LLVIGYADGIGSEESNQDLSERRAVAVAAYLSSRGVDLPIETLGKGEECAVDDVDDPSRRMVLIAQIPPGYPDTRVDDIKQCEFIGGSGG
jgi:OOP family OmpA-OmpF porin